MEGSARKDESVSVAQMSCDEVGELMYLYICDELEPEEATQISMHLAKCSSCRSGLSETVKLTGTLSAVMPRIPLHYYSANN